MSVVVLKTPWVPERTQVKRKPGSYKTRSNTAIKRRVATGNYVPRASCLGVVGVAPTLSMRGQFKLIEQSYGHGGRYLVLAKGNIAKQLDNDAVVRFLTKCQPGMLAKFEDIVQTESNDK